MEEFEASGDRTKTEAFQCTHGVCRACHTRLLGESDNRCPVCRAPRIGLTAEEAEPDPGRNHRPPTLADALADLGIQVEQGELAQRGPGLATGAARGYGGLQGLAFRPPAPTMFFPIDPPVSLPQSRGGGAPQERDTLEQMVQRITQAMAAASEQGSENLNAPRVPVDLLGIAMPSEDVRTLLDFGASAGFALPPIGRLDSALRALIDIPSVSLSDWNAIHSGSAQPIRSAVANRRRGRRVSGLLGPRRSAP